MSHVLKHSLAVFFILLAIAGCGKKTMLPDELSKLTTRVYPNHSTQDIHNASSDLFFLADDRAFLHTHTPDKFTAIRHHSLDIGLTFVEAKDTWNIGTKKTSLGTLVTVDTRSDESWINGKTKTQKPEGPATYEQFWNRLDYLLGQSKYWMTCRDLTNEYLDDETWGDTWWLCSEVKDRIPPELILGQWETAKGLPLTLKDKDACSQAVRAGDYGATMTARQQEVYQSLCLQEKGYEKVYEPDETES